MTRGVVGTTPSAAASSELGERVGADALRFVRHVRAPIQRVWQALTTPAELAAWLGRPIAIELRPGGAFALDLTAEDRMDGRVIELDPPRRLVLEWHETSAGVSSPFGTLAGDTSVVSFELATADDGGTTLVFMHRYILPGETMRGFGAGWHALLDALQALLVGAPPVDGPQRYAALKPLYDERIGGTA